MPNYLIAFNDEWVRDHTLEQLHYKSDASAEVLKKMTAASVFVFGNGGLDASTVVCSVENQDG